MKTKRTFTFKHTLLLLLLGLPLLSWSQLKPGDLAPDFKLVNVDYNEVALSDYQKAKGILLVFTCNHCPWAKLYEQRFIDFHKKYDPLQFPLIAINPNDSLAFKEDSFSEMQNKQYPFPYLLDNQGIYARYGATKTPHIYLLSNQGGQFKVAYTGAFDDNPREADKVQEKYVEAAIADLQSGQSVKLAQTKAIGCGIKGFQ
jgi:peroxiredoxin